MNNTFYSKNDYRNYIAHFGVKGMKWGVRRYQNANGSYTSAGKRRYGVGDGQSYSPVGRRGGGSASPDQRTARRARLKKAALAVGGAAALAGAGYLAYKHNKGFRNAVQGARDFAKEAKFQAQVRGENAAYVAKKGISNGIKNAPGNIRQAGRNLRTGALRTAGQVVYSRPGQAVGRVAGKAAGGIRGAASGLAKRARLGAQGLGDVAKEAKFQAQVRGENAAYVAKKGISNGIKNAPGNIRQAGRNLRTGALRTAGQVVYGKPGQAVGKAAGSVRGAASGLAKKARLGGQGLGDIAKEARFQAQVRGENAAYVAKKGIKNAAKNATSASYWRQAGRNARTGALRTAGKVYNAVNDAHVGRNVRSGAVKAAGRVRNAVNSIPNTPRNRNIARAVGGVVGGAAGYAAGRAARNAYDNRRANKEREANNGRRRRR